MRTGFAPRKRRTRQHVIADQSVHHLEGFIIDEGHTAQRVEKDYGYDLLLFTYDHRGYAEPGLVYLQLKAADSWRLVGGACVFDVDIRDYHLWMLERMPVILVVFDASRRRAWWLDVKGYFREDAGRQPRRGAKTVRVRIPSRQRMNRRAIIRLRDLKEEKLGKAKGETS